MRILYVVTSAGFGGASMHVLQLMKFSKSQGYQVGLVSAPEPRLINEAKELGVEIFENPYFVRRFHLINDIKAFFPVYRAIRKFKPDIIHAHSTKAGIIARFWAGILKVKPVIFTAHGWAFSEGREYWKRWIFALIERIAAKVTTKIICVSKYDKMLALKFKVASPDKLIVIHNGVDVNLFKNLKKTKIDDEVVITFVGRLVPQKNVFLLIDAMERIDNAKLWIVGDGELKDKVIGYIFKKKLNHKITLLGERSDIPNILSQSDIFALPSRWEGLPLTIIEAMMAGLPVVASDVGGVSELVDNGVTGFIVPPGNIELFVDALKTLVNSENLRQEMGKAGLNKAFEKFSLDNMLSKTNEVYQEVLRSKSLLKNVKDI